MAKAIAKKGSTDMFSNDVPDWMNDAGRGQEGVGMEDLSIPRIEIVQSLSPERKKNDPQYIDGAEEGLLFNTVTRSLYGEQLTFVPVYFRKEFVIWRLRDMGGGFRGAYDTHAAADHALNQMDDPENHEILDTAQQFGLVVLPESTVDEPVTEEVVISMTKSKMKASRQLNTMVKMGGGDRFSRAYQLSTMSVDGPKGDYYTYSVKQLGFVNEALFRRAESLYEAIREGQRDVNRDPVE